jgi:hypothetical protein
MSSDMKDFKQKREDMNCVLYRPLEEWEYSSMA